MPCGLSGEEAGVSAIAARVEKNASQHHEAEGDGAGGRSVEQQGGAVLANSLPCGGVEAGPRVDSPADEARARGARRRALLVEGAVRDVAGDGNGDHRI